VEQYRGGVRQRLANGMDALGHDDYYNFNNQHFEDTPGAVLVPGDILVTRCVYANTVAQGQLGGNTKAATGQTVQGCESTE
jgi:hypothetical protein